MNHILGPGTLTLLANRGVTKLCTVHIHAIKVRAKQKNNISKPTNCPLNLKSLKPSPLNEIKSKLRLMNGNHIQRNGFGHSRKAIRKTLTEKQFAGLSRSHEWDGTSAGLRARNEKTRHARKLLHTPLCNTKQL